MAWSEDLGTDSEWTLRAQNILWSGIAVFFLWRAGLMLGMPWLCLVLAGYPFVWTYTNEFRPYAMQIAFRQRYALFIGNNRKYSHIGLGLILLTAWLAESVLCATSMIGVSTFGPVFGACNHPPQSDILNLRHVALPTAPACVMIINLGVYYAWTLSKGAGGAKVWDPGLGNIFFSVYELLGFTGLGPSRVDVTTGNNKRHRRCCFQALYISHCSFGRQLRLVIPYPSHVGSERVASNYPTCSYRPFC